MLKSGSDSPYVAAAAIPVGLSIFHTAFNRVNTVVLVWFISPIAKFAERTVRSKIAPEKGIEEPNFFSSSLLNYPQILIVSLEKESKYLYENAIFEIVAHAMNIHKYRFLISK